MPNDKGRGDSRYGDRAGSTFVRVFRTCASALGAVALAVAASASVSTAASAASRGSADITPAASPESSPSSPPLATDDPGTPGAGGYELNFIIDCDHAVSDRLCASGIDAAFGMGDKAQLRISKYRVHERAAGEEALNGLGPTDVGVKYRFHESHGWRLATFPSIDLDDGTRHHRVGGTPIPREGRSLYLPLIVSKEFAAPGHPMTVVGNVAYRSHFRQFETDSSFGSIAVGIAVDESSRAMAEVTKECNRHWQQCRNDVRVGFVHALFESATHAYQTSLFASAGIGKDAARDVHRTLLIGVSVAFAPQ